MKNLIRYVVERRNRGNITFPLIFRFNTVLVSLMLILHAPGNSLYIILKTSTTVDQILTRWIQSKSLFDHIVKVFQLMQIFCCWNISITRQFINFSLDFLLDICVFCDVVRCNGNCCAGCSVNSGE